MSEVCAWRRTGHLCCYGKPVRGPPRQPMKIPKPPEDDVLPAFATILLAAIVALFAVRNLPWHLDDLDQAKQAFVSSQMVDEGRWLVQQTPTGDTATKPPLQGWLSAWVFLGA